jgi:hypothetical protein
VPAALAISAATALLVLHVLALVRRAVALHAAMIQAVNASNLHAEIQAVVEEMRGSAWDIAVLSDTGNVNAQVAARQIGGWADRLARLTEEGGEG